MDVTAVGNPVVSQIPSSDGNTDVDVAMLKKANGTNKVVVTYLLEALPKPIPSPDPNLGRNLDVYA